MWFIISKNKPIRISWLVKAINELNNTLVDRYSHMIIVTIALQI